MILKASDGPDRGTAPLFPRPVVAKESASVAPASPRRGCACLDPQTAMTNGEVAAGLALPDAAPRSSPAAVPPAASQRVWRSRYAAPAVQQPGRATRHPGGSHPRYVPSAPHRAACSIARATNRRRCTALHRPGEVQVRRTQTRFLLRRSRWSEGQASAGAILARLASHDHRNGLRLQP